MNREALIVVLLGYFVVATTPFSFSFPEKRRPRRAAKPFQCLKCENKSRQTCITDGKIEKCQCQADIQQSCETEIRYEDDDIVVNTGCKKATACINDEAQDLGAACDPTECIREQKAAICLCSCNTSDCNKGSLLFRERAISPDYTHDSAPVEGFIAPKDRCHPLPERPENGDYECNGTGKLGTKCEFTCDTGYDLIGRKHTVCVAGVSASKSVTSHRVHNMKAAWSNPTPTCREVRCTLPNDPTNGHRECPGDGKLGTVCDFACHLGYRLKGFSSTTCKGDEQTGDARWTRKVPNCEPLCMTIPEKPEYGSKKCDGKGEIGTLCTFECFSGYELTGSETTSCEMSRQEPIWTHETPICAPVCKPLPEAPQNGDKTCDGEGEIGTVCTYKCDDGFRLKGQSESECKAVENGADWSAQVPTCIPPPKCPPIGELANGEPNCNNDIHVVGTECNFQCMKGFNLVPTTKNPVVCLKNLTWSKKPCCIECTKVKRDIMIAMDTSGSMTEDGWNDMKRFVKNFISKFAYGPDATRFSIFSFGDGLYDKMRFDSAKTLKQLKKHVSRMKYKKGGTWTGKALNYANEEFEKDSNRKDAPDILLVLTAGKVKNANKQMMEEQAEILRDNKVEILALAINPNRMSREFNETEFYEQMENMTGDRNKVIKAGSTKELSENMDLLFSKECQDERLCKR